MAIQYVGVSISSGANSMGHGGTCPHFYKWLGTGEHREQKNSKQKTGQTVMTITKALTKTTKCAFRAKKWRGTTPKIFTALCAGSVPPLPFSNSFRRHCP